MEEGLRNRFLYRSGIEDCPALLFQQRQIVRQIVNGLFPFQTPLCAVQYTFRQDRWRPFRETPLQRPLCRTIHRGQSSCCCQSEWYKNGPHDRYFSCRGQRDTLWKRVKILLFLRQHEPHVGFLAPDLVGQILACIFPGTEHSALPWNPPWEPGRRYSFCCNPPGPPQDPFHFRMRDCRKWLRIHSGPPEQHTRLVSGHERRNHP